MLISKPLETVITAKFDPLSLKFSCHDANVNAVAAPGTIIHLNQLGIVTSSDDQTNEH